VREPYIVADLTGQLDRIGWLPAPVSSDSTVGIEWRFVSESHRTEKEGTQ